MNVVKARHTLILTGAIALATVAPASEIVVQRTKVHEGAWAATLTLGEACSGERDLEVTDPVGKEHFVACTKLGSDAEVSDAITFEAGQRVVLRSGFRVLAGVPFRSRITSRLHPDAYLLDLSPESEQVYAARLWLNTDDFRPSAATEFDHLAAHDSAGNFEFRVIVRQARGPEMLVEVVEDDGARILSDETPLALPANGWHSVEIVWTRSSGADDGSVRLCIDKTDCATLTGLDNDTGSIDTVHWGARRLKGGSAGALHLDAFRSFRDARLLDVEAPRPSSS